MSHKDDVFIKVFIGVLLGLVVFTIAIIILANSVGRLEQESVGSTRYGSESTVEERIQPVGKVRVAGQAPPETAAPAAAAPAERSGAEIVQAACAACHTTGVAGAPKTGVAEDWTARAAQGMPVLLDRAINGYKGMPAKGGNPTLSDEDVKKAVIYMLEQVGASTAGTAAAAPAQVSAAPAAGEGEKVYNTACAMCHTTGAAGAPRVGDTGVWGTRIAQGMDVLNEHAIKGFQAMPPKGGRLDLSDGAVVAAVAYMVENSK